VWGGGFVARFPNGCAFFSKPASARPGSGVPAGKEESRSVRAMAAEIEKISEVNVENYRRTVQP